VDALLGRVHHGRLGVISEGRPYIVPVGFVWVDGCLFFHSAPGRKTRALQADPQCCFEVDEYDQRTAAWASVIAWGTAAPGATPAAWQAMKARFGHVLDQVLSSPREGASRGQLWQITISELTGRSGP